MGNNTLKYIVAAALLINVAALIFFWLNRPPLRDGKPPKRLEHVVIDELKLDKNQIDIYTTQHQQHHRVHDSLLQRIAHERHVLYNQKQGANDSILQKIGSLQQEIERVTYDHFMGVRKICRPDQQAVLDTLLDRTVQRLLMPKGDKAPK